VLKEKAYKISARIRRTENIQLYVTSTMEETLRWVASNTTKGADPFILDLLNFTALTGHCVVCQIIIYFFLK
jgi:hypothetical protein